MSEIELKFISIIMPLTKLALEIRQDIILMSCNAGAEDPGEALSLTEIVTHLFHRELNFHPDNVEAEERDRFVLSIGHSSLALDAILVQRGFLSRKAYRSFRQVNGEIQGDARGIQPFGLECNASSPGHGFSFALGVALGTLRKKLKSRVYVLIDEADLNKGQIWEAMMFGARFGLDNLVAIVVCHTERDTPNWDSLACSHSSLPEKIHAFGWQCLEIDGHSFREIAKAMDTARATRGLPTIILAHTTKGKGVSFMEGNCGWHGNLATNSKERSLAFEECGLDAEGLEA